MSLLFKHLFARLMGRKVHNLCVFKGQHRRWLLFWQSSHHVDYFERRKDLVCVCAFETDAFLLHILLWLFFIEFFRSHTHTSGKEAQRRRTLVFDHATVVYDYRRLPFPLLVFLLLFCWSSFFFCWPERRGTEDENQQPTATISTSTCRAIGNKSDVFFFFLGSHGSHCGLCVCVCECVLLTTLLTVTTHTHERWSSTKFTFDLCSRCSWRRSLAKVIRIKVLLSLHLPRLPLTTRFLITFSV